MINTTCDSIPGYRVTQTLGLVKGNAVRARNLGLDILAVFKNMVGGEISDYTKMMAEAREQALDRMNEQARQLGAVGVVAIRFVSAQIMQGAAELLCYGTAVVAEKDETVS